jgi:hypothetical protein
VGRLRGLLLGSHCDPAKVSIRFVICSHEAPLSKLYDVTVV